MSRALSHVVAVIVLLAPQLASSGLRRTSADPAGSAVATMAVEFPKADLSLWAIERRDLNAAARLAAAPADPETLAFLLEQEQPADALAVLRRIVTTRPADIPAALVAVEQQALLFAANQPRNHEGALTEILTLARRRLPDLPREQAARAAFVLASIDNHLTPAVAGAFQAQLARLVSEYSGTEAAQLAQVDLIVQGRVSRVQLDELNQFARSHAGTSAGAKALFTRGFQLATNVPVSGLEPRGSDPSPRFLEVLEIVRELESGAYPPSAWVSQAPALVTGFFAAAPVYANGSLDRMLDAMQAFVKSHFFGVDGQPAPDVVEDAVTRRMADLYDRKGEPVVGVERTLTALEQGAAGHDAAKFMRAAFYVSVRRSRPLDERAALTRKAIETLTTLHDEADGLYERKSLAELASLQFADGALADARDSYQTYVSAYPESAWAWVAALRVGQCDAALGDWPAADEAYRQVVNRFPSVPVASVLGEELGARASEALGNFDEALLEHQHALEAWRSDDGQRYMLPGSSGSEAAGGIAVSADEVSTAGLTERITQLARTLGQPGGAELERGRRLLTTKERPAARSVFERVIRDFPASPLVPEARYLAHRATLEDVLSRLDASRAPGAQSGEDELAALTQAPFDPAVGAARIARAAMLWIRGDTTVAETQLQGTLDEWYAHQPKAAAPASGLERDLAEIRALVFRQGGGGLLEGARWNAFTWPATPPLFAIVNPEVPVRLADGSVRQVAVRTALPGKTKTLFLMADQIAMLDALVDRVGGPATRPAIGLMERPNQPAGPALDVMRLMNRFFAARPGHWSGWVFETYPIITQVEFLDTARTRAALRVTVGASGATVVLEKPRGAWRAAGLVDRWIT